MKASDKEILKAYYCNHDAIRKDISRLQRPANNAKHYYRDRLEKATQCFDFYNS